MSIQAVAWVLNDSEARGMARLVLISLANHANTHGVAWPSLRTIANEARIAASTVHGAVGRLVVLGELVVLEEGNARRSARYQLTFRPGAGPAGVREPNAPPVDNPPEGVRLPNAAFGQRSADAPCDRPGPNAAFGSGRAESSSTIREPSNRAPHPYPCSCPLCEHAILELTVGGRP